jgi:GntR family transcriptional regulator, phosphonate transport system regulatory protein
MTNARAYIWQSIAQTLQSEIALQHYGLGGKLPTEAVLAKRFGVNRHTVRRALASLAEAGVVHARRGAGVFVTFQPTEYALGNRVRFHQNILDSGRMPSRQITRLDTCPASLREAQMLALQKDAQVHVIEGISMADGAPVALFRSVFPAARFSDLLVHMQGQNSVSAALSACGLPDYTRAQTNISAKLADALQAHALLLPQGAPLLRTQAVNVDALGNPVEFGTTWFAGGRVTLTVQSQNSAGHSL